ncbi:cytochrome o ubiquinol oxidase subunit 2 [Nitrobacteraceae bacterium AZCC 1564]
MSNVSFAAVKLRETSDAKLSLAGLIVRRFRQFALLPLVAMLGACKAVVLSPSGDVAEQQRDILIQSTSLMLLIVVPVMALIAIVAWRYRESNTTATYEPEWDHSTHLELVIWSVPLLIIICIGAITWASTHLLDPYRQLGRIAEERPIAANTKALRVDVVALDWKWLFIYPEYNIATVNEMAAPVDRPIDFHITASSVMNSFFVPALAGQVYAMPAMQTQLKAVINKPGVYEGFSANYSGAGFSGMRFAFLGVNDADFDSWIGKARAESTKLDRAAYLQLEKPSENEPVRRYASVDSTLFNAIINMCVEPSKMCMSEMSAIDSKGGLGLEGARNTLPLTYDKYARRGAVFGVDPAYVASLCTVQEAEGRSTEAQALPAVDLSRLKGAGLPPPSFTPLRSPPSLSLNATRRPSNT